MSEVSETRKGSEAATRETGGRSEAGRSTEAPVLVPAGDIFEHTDGITLLLDMPGVSRDRLDIQSDRNTLTVEGRVEIEMPKDTESLYADVRSTCYRRSFSLSGEQLDTDQVSATLKNGVLRIDIPKRAEIRPRRIEVQAD